MPRFHTAWSVVQLRMIGRPRNLAVILLLALPPARAGAQGLSLPDLIDALLEPTEAMRDKEDAVEMEKN